MDWIYPTERQAVRALVNAIASHRDVKNANVYYPLVIGEPQQVTKVPIVSFRTFGGTEYIEDGVTLAVYPPPKSMGYGPALSFKSNVLGNTDKSHYNVKGTLKLIVQLFYREPSFNVPSAIYSDASSLTKDIVRMLPYGRLVQYKDDYLREPATLLEDKLPLDRLISENTIEVTILPGEEILRDWMSVIRGVIRDLPSLQPLAVRNPNIISVEYETGNWREPDTKNLVFHTALMLIEYDLYEPPRACDLELPVIGYDYNITNFPVVKPNIPEEPSFTPPLPERDPIGPAAN